MIGYPMTPSNDENESDYDRPARTARSVSFSFPPGEDEQRSFKEKGLVKRHGRWTGPTHSDLHDWGPSEDFNAWGPSEDFNALPAVHIHHPPYIDGAYHREVN